MWLSKNSVIVLKSYFSFCVHFKQRIKQFLYNISDYHNSGGWWPYQNLTIIHHHWTVWPLFTRKNPPRMIFRQSLWSAVFSFSYVCTSCLATIMQYSLNTASSWFRCLYGVKTITPRFFAQISLTRIILWEFFSKFTGYNVKMVYYIYSQK